MILTNITLTDFATFRGSQSVSLLPQSSRPIILFGGKNGSGKSTFLEAIRLCLYGPGALGTAVSREAYLDYLATRIHSNPNALIQPKFASVALEFRYADIEAVHTYKVIRSWEKRSLHSVVEHLEVTRDGDFLDDVEGNQWQDFLADLIPPGVCQLFFFDGERIQQLAEDSSDQATLAEAIKSLLGLNVVERLQADLAIYISRTLRPNRNGQQNQELQSIEEGISNLKQELARLYRAREQCKNRCAELQSAIAQLEAKIRSEGGVFAGNRQNSLQRQIHIKARIAQHEESLRDFCAGLFPFALIPKLCTELRQQLLREESATQIRSGQALVAKAKREILARLEISGLLDDFPPLTGALKETLLRRIRDEIQKPLSVEQVEPTELVHQMAIPVQRQILSWIQQATNEIPERLRILGGELETLHRDLHKVEAALRKIPPDEILRPLLEQLHVLHKELAEISKEALLQDDTIRREESKLADLQRQYNLAAERIAQLAAQRNRLNLTHKIQKALEEYESVLLQKKVVQLEKAASECFNRLCRKKDSLRQITVNPKDFSITLYDKQNRPLPKNQLSAGEKQIYAISMLWALGKTSGRPLPIIIDTPLARLDSDHRRLLIQNYFPAASQQVIILSTDTEVDRTYFAELRRDISHSYRLDFDPEEDCTKITPGYFWKDAHEAR
ncbi:MAG TPA: DNA sulfur modification protein DndD [Candidatus Eisenbacteria bacterium]|nr:DNA sulfur modification protein DndD [Candidatus Eisenbacteria bacterium]